MHAYLTAMANTTNENIKIYKHYVNARVAVVPSREPGGDPICIQETPSRSPGDTRVATHVSHHVCGRGRRHTGEAQEASRQLQ